MKENENNCEENCVFFKALLPNYKDFNRKAREATEKGEEFPGSARSLCGTCVRMEKNRL